jgi:prepilin-type N-terminal cleavage/methylation domain-containing protein/prepilin-type processing-associated H-X9-DG protein
MRKRGPIIRFRGSWLRAFTLIELLVAVTMIGLLAAIMLPSLAKARRQGKSAVCASNLHQLGVAANMYLNEHNDAFWPFQWDSPEGINWWFGLEPEGPHPGDTDRPLDRDRSILAKYIENVHEAFLCPSFPYTRGCYFPKFKDRSTSYGYNVHLIPWRRDRIERPTEVFLFADGVHFDFHDDRVNEPSYIQYAANIRMRTGYGHFRHNNEQANVQYVDGHVESQPLRGPAYSVNCEGPAGNLTDRAGGNSLYYVRPVPRP